jgi:hypothetical protein
LQSAAFVPSLFLEASSFAASLQQQGRLDVPAAPPGGDPAGLPAWQQSQGGLSGGAVAEMLDSMAAGRLELRPHRVRITPHLSAAAAAAAEAEGSTSWALQTAELEVKVPVRVTAVRRGGAGGGSEGSAAEGSAAEGSAAGGGAAAAAAEEHEGEGMGASADAPAAAAGTTAEERAGSAASTGGLTLGKLKFTHQERVLFQPSMVASSNEVASAAVAACHAAAAASGVSAAAFDGALAALRSAGCDGLSQRQLADALQQQAAGGSSGGNAAAAGTAERLVEQLLLHGLARSICGFSGRRYAASEHSQGLLAFPFVVGEAEAAQLEDAGAQTEAARRQLLLVWRAKFCREVQRLVREQGLPPSGHLQPCIDVPVRPWVDHHGNVNSQLWEGLVHRALAAAARQPGARVLVATVAMHACILVVDGGWLLGLHGLHSRVQL